MTARKPWAGGGPILLLLRSAPSVQFKEEWQRIFPLADAVAGSNGPIESLVGEAKRVLTGVVELGVEIAQGEAVGRHQPATRGPQRHRGAGDLGDLHASRTLRPREAVEYRVRRVARIALERRAAPREPCPVDPRVKDAKRVVVRNREDRERVARVNLRRDEDEDRPFGHPRARNVPRRAPKERHELAARVRERPPSFEKVRMMMVDVCVGVIGEHLSLSYSLSLGGLLAVG